MARHSCLRVLFELGFVQLESPSLLGDFKQLESLLIFLAVGADEIEL